MTVKSDLKELSMQLKTPNTEIPILNEEQMTILSKEIDELSIEELFASIPLNARLNSFSAQAALELIQR